MPYQIRQICIDNTKFYSLNDISFGIYDNISAIKNDIRHYRKKLVRRFDPLIGEVLQGQSLIFFLKWLVKDENDLTFASRITGLIKLLRKEGHFLSKRRLNTSAWKTVGARQKWRCAACGHLLEDTFEIDHVRSLHLGGLDSLSNLQALCPNCHAKKTKIEKCKSINYMDN